MFTSTHLSDHAQDHMTSIKTTPTTKGWRFALMSPWASRHIGGSWSIPTIQRCPQGKAVGSPKAPQSTTTVRLKHLHGSGAGSLKPQIYDATTELDDKIRLRVFPRSRNVQEPTGSLTGSPAGYLERDSAGELREAPRQHVQMYQIIHQKQV